MIKDFKYCYINFGKVYLEDSKGNKFTITMENLMEILNNADLTATKQRKNYKLEAN